ncbi:MAG: protein-L-isoaspartate O-methyltransferase [Candidatus Aenigmarchaeota archaeon]|nr:protein-L-isoaspartate O-methyltransferase [Candidatus Aenigmarchaeota archaeon]
MDTVAKAMSKVRRELFVPTEFIKSASMDQPIAIPGGQTISASHMHRIVLSELDLKPGEKFLEVGAGSGIMLAYAKEMVGKEGKVVGMEINMETYKFGKACLKKAGYKNVTYVHGDGSMGYPKYAPYDKIAISAASPDIPKPLISQLKSNGVILAVIGAPEGEQHLIKIRKTKSGDLISKNILSVIFVPLRGKYGWS